MQSPSPRPIALCSLCRDDRNPAWPSGIVTGVSWTVHGMARSLLFLVPKYRRSATDSQRRHAATGWSFLGRSAIEDFRKRLGVGGRAGGWVVGGGRRGKGDGGRQRCRVGVHCGGGGGQRGGGIGWHLYRRPRVGLPRDELLKLMVVAGLLGREAVFAPACPGKARRKIDERLLAPPGPLPPPTIPPLRGLVPLMIVGCACV